MRRSLAVLFAAACAVVAMSAMAGGSSAATATTHQWKFDPTINAPWAMEGDDEELDAPDAAAGLCRSAPFNTPAGAYAPLAPTEVDAINGDPTNNSGFSNFGCTTPQNETTIAANPTEPQQSRRRRERLPCLLRLHRSERRHRLGVLLVRRWPDVGQRAASCIDRGDGSYRHHEEIRLGRRSRVGIQSRRSRLLRQHRLQPGQLRVGHRRQQFSRRRQDVERAEPVRQCQCRQLLQRQGVDRGRAERARSRSPGRGSTRARRARATKSRRS